MISTEDLVAQRALMTPSDDRLDCMLNGAIGRGLDSFGREARLRFGFIASHLALMVGAAGAGRDDLFQILCKLGKLPGGQPLSPEESEFALHYLKVSTDLDTGLPGFINAQDLRRLVRPVANTTAIQGILHQ